MHGYFAAAAVIHAMRSGKATVLKILPADILKFLGAVEVPMPSIWTTINP
jgi:hypothetical protein